jgi:hypothetical protein
MYHGAKGYPGSLHRCNYMHILHGGFPHVSGVCSIFFFDIVSDSGKVLCILYCVLYILPRLLTIRQWFFLFCSSVLFIADVLC